MDIDNNGGRRIKDISKEIEFFEREKEMKKKCADDYLAIAEKIGLSFAGSAGTFFQNRIKAEYENQGASLADRLIELENQRKTADDLGNNCRQFSGFTRFEDILWQKIAQKIHALAVEKEKIEQSSDILKTLKKQLVEIEGKIIVQEKEKTEKACS